MDAMRTTGDPPPHSALPACDSPPAPGTVAEYESRRCAICGAKYPGLGFGPPMTRPGAVIWACFTHWRDVERQIVDLAKPAADEGAQARLL